MGAFCESLTLTENHRGQRLRTGSRLQASLSCSPGWKVSGTVFSNLPL